MKRTFNCLEFSGGDDSQPDHKRAKLSRGNLNSHETDDDHDSSDNTDKHIFGIDKQSCEQRLKTILSTISKHGELAVSGIGNKYLPDSCGLQLPNVSTLNQTQNNIYNLLKLWDDENSNVITLKLKHSYDNTIKGIGINCFKGIDFERALSLIKANEFLVC